MNIDFKPTLRNIFLVFCIFHLSLKILLNIRKRKESISCLSGLSFHMYLLLLSILAACESIFEISKGDISIESDSDSSWKVIQNGTPTIINIAERIIITKSTLDYSININTGLKNELKLLAQDLKLLLSKGSCIAINNSIVDFEIEGEVNFKSTDDSGLYMNTKSRVTIHKSPAATETRLTATGSGNGAGIGGYGVLILKDLIIDATSTSYGAAIGGVKHNMNESTSIQIINCNIHARSGENGAAIGAAGADSTVCVDIHIVNSTIDASSGVGASQTNGAAIGGGHMSYANIIIENSNIKAITGKKSYAAAIGGGSIYYLDAKYYGGLGNITIKSSTVEARSSELFTISDSGNFGSGAGIGGGGTMPSTSYPRIHKLSFFINISDSTINANGVNVNNTYSYSTGSYVAGSGIGLGGNGLQISTVLELIIKNSTVHAYGGNTETPKSTGHRRYGGPGIGGFHYSTGYVNIKLIDSHIFGSAGTGGNTSFIGHQNSFVFEGTSRIHVRNCTINNEQTDSSDHFSMAAKNIAIERSDVSLLGQFNSIVCLTDRPFLYIALPIDVDHLVIKNIEDGTTYEFDKVIKYLGVTLKSLGNYEITGEKGEEKYTFSPTGSESPMFVVDNILEKNVFLNIENKLN